MGERIYVRLSEEEKERLRVKAAEKGLSLSSYIRMILFNCDIEIKNK